MPKLFRTTERREKMKRILPFAIVLMALTACAAPKIQAAPDPVATETLRADMPNPATQKASNDDAGENASGGYMPPGTQEQITDWWGVIKRTQPGAQYDDYFERQDLGQIIYFGIDATEPAVKARIEALRDSGKIVYLYGTLLSNVPDYNGSQIRVDRIEIKE
jgi:hypothetical protein